MYIFTFGYAHSLRSHYCVCVIPPPPPQPHLALHTARGVQQSSHESHSRQQGEEVAALQTSLSTSQARAAETEHTNSQLEQRVGGGVVY